MVQQKVLDAYKELGTCYKKIGEMRHADPITNEEFKIRDQVYQFIGENLQLAKPETFGPDKFVEILKRIDNHLQANKAVQEDETAKAILGDVTGWEDWKKEIGFILADNYTM